MTKIAQTVNIWKNVQQNGMIITNGCIKMSREEIFKASRELCDKLSNHFLCGHCPLTDYTADGGECCVLDRIKEYLEE